MVVVQGKRLLVTTFCRGLVFQFRTRTLAQSVIGRRSNYSADLDTESRVSTASYLADSCGLSWQDAVAASKRVSIRNSVRADSFLALLRDYGLTNVQISKIIRTQPRILLGNAEKIYQPKIEFLLSIGASKDALGKLLCGNSSILLDSLEKSIRPFYNFLKHEILLEDKDIVRSLQCHVRGFSQRGRKNIANNVTKLRELGTPQSAILRMLTFHRGLAILESEDFNRATGELISTGFKPTEPKFIDAILALGLCVSTREVKHGVYRKWGWSEEDIQYAFRRYPECMRLSAKNIESTMDFLVNKMHYSSSDIAGYPFVLFHSLKKRIIPRCSVLEVLQATESVKKSPSLASLLHLSEENFLHRFVTRYVDKFPDLLSVYQGKISPEKLIS